MKIPKIIFALTVALIVLTACGTVASRPATEPTLPATEALPTVAGPSSSNEAQASPTAVPTTEPEMAQSEEQTVLSAFSKPVTANGEPLILYGHVLDRNGEALSGYALEIWQVDANGIYDHPGDSNTASRDMGFQFYGTALTDENGLFAFRTIVPARYEPRPRHIHFKVKKDGAEVLTSQFYFTGDVEAGQLGSAGDMLLLDMVATQDASGSAVKLGSKDIVVDTGAGGNTTLTPSQMEGPYYPVVDVAQFDNDLASVQ